MAFGWLAILKIVPWSEVISNAPKVADGARKLWNAVAKKAASPTVLDLHAQPPSASEPHTLAALEVRTSALEAVVSDLQGQMLACSELIKTLADQNAQLIHRIETQRARLLWLCAASAVLAVAALLGPVLAFWRHGA